MRRVPGGEVEPLSRQLTVDALRGRALALLARREHSQGEIRQKLHDQGGNSADIEAVLSELVQRGLQADSRFAEVFVRSRAVRGYGPRVISADLKSRGLDNDQIDEALSGSGYDWTEQAVELRQRRFGRALPTELRERARQLRFLQYRGFSGAQAGRALRCDVLDED